MSDTTKAVLCCLITWIAQSANSPISRMEAELLLNKLNEPTMRPDTPHEKTCLCDACTCAGCGETKHKGKCRRGAR